MLDQALNGEFSFYDDESLALKNYHDYGFHIERDFLDKAYCDRIVNHGLQLKEALQGNFRPALMPHKEDRIFLETLKEEKTVRIIEKLVDGIPSGMQTQFFYCKPGTRGFSLHQDNFYIEADFGVFVSTWIPLVDTYPEKGGLIIYPGSHQERILPVRKLHYKQDDQQDRNANNEETVVPSHYEPHHLSLSKGSALFIHAHLVHGSNDNRSEEWRYALLNLYIRMGENFRSGNSAKREPIALYSSH